MTAILCIKKPVKRYRGTVLPSYASYAELSKLKFGKFSIMLSRSISDCV